MEALYQIYPSLRHISIFFALFTLHIWHNFNIEIFPFDNPSEFFHPKFSYVSPNKLNKFIPTIINEARDGFVLLRVRFIINPHEDIFGKGGRGRDFDEPNFIIICMWDDFFQIKICKGNKYDLILWFWNLTYVFTSDGFNMKKSIVF